MWCGTSCPLQVQQSIGGPRCAWDGIFAHCRACWPPTSVRISVLTWQNEGNVCILQREYSRKAVTVLYGSDAIRVESCHCSLSAGARCSYLSSSSCGSIVNFWSVRGGSIRSRAWSLGRQRCGLRHVSRFPRPASFYLKRMQLFLSASLTSLGEVAAVHILSLEDTASVHLQDSVCLFAGGQC